MSDDNIDRQAGLRFKKIFDRRTEGIHSDAIISVLTIPVRVEGCDHGNQGHAVVVESLRRIRIDLWLLRILVEQRKVTPNTCKARKELA